MVENYLLLVLLLVSSAFDGYFCAIVDNGIPRGRNQILRERNYYQMSNRQRLQQPVQNLNQANTACDCGQINSDIRALRINVEKLQDKISQMELAIEVLTQRQTSGYSAETQPRNVILTRPQPTPTTTTPTTTTTSTTITTTELEITYPPVDCGGNGFYQVGESCYTFTFYRSLTFKDAQTFCNVSGGYLAAIDSLEERQWLIHHLNKHVASNIYPYETVTFFVGGNVQKETGNWILSSDLRIDASETAGDIGDNDAVCKGDHYVGDCLGITWNQQLGCRFSLTDTECNLKERFICERDPN